jgi:hypothetical protein
MTEIKAREGHCLVPQDHPPEDGYKNLGTWVHTQRKGKDMTPERKKRLDEIGFVWVVGKGRARKKQPE